MRTGISSSKSQTELASGKSVVQQFQQVSDKVEDPTEQLTETDGDGVEISIETSQESAKEDRHDCG